MNSVALRIQELSPNDQVLVLAQIAQGRAETGRFSPNDVGTLFDELAISRPSNISQVMSRVEGDDLLSRRSGRGPVWAVAPKGRARIQTLIAAEEWATLAAELATSGAPVLGGLAHPVVPPQLAPPALLGPLSKFLTKFPFEMNVFGMTRFPRETENGPDPVVKALEVADAACKSHGLAFHLASDRAICDDLLGNVAAHMWASRYGIAFFERRSGAEINYNMTIEVGGMLTTGRRCLLLRDVTIDRMPTDLVGQIYKSVDLTRPKSIGDAVHVWLAEDLGLGRCVTCPESSRAR